MQISDSRFSNVLTRPMDIEKNGKSFPEEFLLGENRIKNFVKKWPLLYHLIRVLIAPGSGAIGGPSVGKILKKAFGNSDLTDKIILNLGSGTRRLHKEIINIDVYPFENVDIVADIKNIPIRDGACDMVICDSVLEHVGEVGIAIQEITRVIKKGGYLYVTVPFIYPFHASPNDYYRWTQNGIKKIFQGFTPLVTGISAGPAAALHGLLSHMMALLFSFYSERAYYLLLYFFMAIFAPLKILDIIFNIFPKSHEIASVIYFFGKKD